MHIYHFLSAVVSSAPFSLFAYIYENLFDSIIVFVVKGHCLLAGQNHAEPLGSNF